MNKYIILYIPNYTRADTACTYFNYDECTYVYTYNTSYYIIMVCVRLCIYYLGIKYSKRRPSYNNVQQRSLGVWSLIQFETKKNKQQNIAILTVGLSLHVL